MKNAPLDGDVLRRILPELALSPMFKGLPPEQLSQVAAHGTLCDLEDGEVVIGAGLRV